MNVPPNNEGNIMLGAGRDLIAFSQAYHADADLRDRAQADPRAVFGEKGIDFPLQADLRIVENTADVFHIALPPDPNIDLSDEALAVIAGGGKSASSAGTATTASTMSSVFSCAGSASSASTVASGGSAG